MQPHDRRPFELRLTDHEQRIGFSLQPEDSGPADHLYKARWSALDCGHVCRSVDAARCCCVGVGLGWLEVRP